MSQSRGPLLNVKAEYSSLSTEIGCFCKKEKISFSRVQLSSVSELVSTRRSTVLILPLQLRFPGQRLQGLFRLRRRTFNIKIKLTYRHMQVHLLIQAQVLPGNTKGGSSTVPLTSCLTGLDQSVLHTADSKPDKHGVNGTVPFSFPWCCHPVRCSLTAHQVKKYLQYWYQGPFFSNCLQASLF